MPRRTFTSQQFKHAVESSTSFKQVFVALGMSVSGSSYNYVKTRAARENVSTDHFLGQAWARGTKALNKKSSDEVLVRLPENSWRAKPNQLRRAMVDCGIEHCCARCGLGPVWNDKPLTLHVDHIDGDPMNCVLGNLRFLCPNCHQQEDTSTSYRKSRATA